ncbi:MAG: GNAT family N-acetyltransferase [Planctomycetota bacterium]|nr:MAG: GNAT family N-acetyltransferase [Planctomycetota bacterium]
MAKHLPGYELRRPSGQALPGEVRQESYVARPLRREEAAEAVAFYRKAHGQPMSEEVWDWRFYSRDKRLQMMPAVFHDSGALVGLVPGTVRPIRVLGTDLLSSQTCHGLVHPDHRGNGLVFLLLIRYFQDYCRALGVPVAFAGSANDAIVKIGRIVGLSLMYKTPWRERRLSTRLAFRRRLGPLGTGVSVAVDAFGPKPQRRFHGKDWQVLTAPDPQFEDLWQKHRDNGSVLVHRSFPELNWRWFQCPVPSTFLALYGQGELLGYLVFRQHEEQGVRLGRLLDLFPCHDEEIVHQLLEAGCWAARRAGCDFLQLLPYEGTPLQEVTRQAPWREARKTPDQAVMQVQTPDPKALGIERECAYLQDGRHWYYCPGDSDFLD